MSRRNIIFSFRTKDDDYVSLNYSLYNNPLVDKWLRLVHLSIRKQLTLKPLFTNKTMDRVDELMLAINNILEYINKHYDKELPVFTDFNQLDNEILNYLHEEFEVYGDRMNELQSNGKWSEKLHDNFLSLNDHIHMIETAIHSQHDKFPNFSSLIDFLPAGMHKTLTAEDKLFISNKFEWGGLYLGYNTLGKDYLTIFPENDQEVIERDEVRVQQRFSTEMWLNFGSTSWTTNTERFYHWYKSLPQKLQEKVPITDPVALSLGRYKIGQLDITKTLLDYHPIGADWITPACHEAYWDDGEPTVHARWNLDVFANINKLERIFILEDDEVLVEYDTVLQ